MNKGKTANRHTGFEEEKQNPVYEAHNSKFNQLIISIIILLGGIIYFNILQAPFTFDDAIIQQEREIASLQAGELDGTVTHPKMIKALLTRTRPVAHLSFYLNYYLGGDNPFGYHLTNVIIHLLSTITVFFLIQITLNLPVTRDRYKDARPKLAAIVSLLFLCHPVQTQAVDFVVQRMASIMALFYLLSILLYLKGRIIFAKNKKLFYIGSAFSALLAFGSKQNAVTLPFFIGLYELYFFQGVDWEKIKKRLPLLGAVLTLPVLLGLIYTKFDLFSRFIEGYKDRPFNMWQRLLSEFRVVVYYISLLFYPHPSRLNLDYDFPFSHSLVNPLSTLLGLSIILGLLGVAFYLIKRRPVVSFCILWYFGHLVIESSIYPLDLVYEHRLYLPSIGFFLIIALAFIKLSSGIPEKLRLKVELGVMGALVILLGWGTSQRNRVWLSEISLWEDVVRKSPNKARPHNNLGKAYAATGLADKTRTDLPDKAIVEYKRAIEINPKNFVAHDNLGQSYGRKGMHKKAIKACRRAVEINPNYLQGYNNLGVAYNKVGMYKEAVKACLEALRIKPNYAKSHFNLGKGYEGLKKYDRALEAYKFAWKLMKNDANIPYNIGNIYFNKGMLDNAEKYYREALKINPDNLDAYYNLGVIYFNAGKYKESVDQYRKIIEMNPAHAPAYERLGLLYMDKLKNYKLALNNFKKVVEFSKSEKDARLARKMIKKLEAKGSALKK